MVTKTELYLKCLPTLQNFFLDDTFLSFLKKLMTKVSEKEMIYVNKNYNSKRWTLPTGQSLHLSTITYFFPFSYVLLCIYLSCNCFRQCYILPTTGTYNTMSALIHKLHEANKLSSGFLLVPTLNHKRKRPAVILMKRLSQFTAFPHFL